MSLVRMSDLDLKGKQILIREDFNVPIKNGAITSDIRIHAALPTIKQALKAGAKVMLLSHLGRPKANTFDEDFSLAPVATRLSELLGFEVPLIHNWLSGVKMGDHDVVLLENVRFNQGETSNNDDLAQKMAQLCDVFVMDAFATSHRQEASTCGLIKHAKEVCFGPLMMAELDALEKITSNPEKPVVAIVGGSKVSTKLSILDSLVEKVDTLIIGGGIANTFLAAEGYEVGRSLYEPDLIDEAERLVIAAQERKANIPIPVDVVVAERLSNDAEDNIKLVSQIDEDEKIFDIGPDTSKKLASIIKKAKTILWNGPVGAFEWEAFSKGTEQIAKAIAASKAFKVAGGGDTLAAIEKYGIADKIDYISTGGGAFLTYLEGKKLPAIAALEHRTTKDNEEVA